MTLKVANRKHRVRKPKHSSRKFNVVTAFTPAVAKRITEAERRPYPLGVPSCD